MYLGLWMRRGELENIAHVGGPESVERLIVVADNPQFDAVTNEMLDELDLARIDVLIFIDQ